MLYGGYGLGCSILCGGVIGCVCQWISFNFSVCSRMFNNIRAWITIKYGYDEWVMNFSLEDLV